MKGTANCAVWYTLLDCREANNVGEECPGCRNAWRECNYIGEERFHNISEVPCICCLFKNLGWRGIHTSENYCSKRGKSLLRAMENV